MRQSRPVWLIRNPFQGGFLLNKDLWFETNNPKEERKFKTLRAAQKALKFRANPKNGRDSKDDRIVKYIRVRG